MKSQLLPGDDYDYRPAHLHPLRSNIYLGSPAGSSDSCLNSIQSLIDVRLGSLRSLGQSKSGGSYRPSSSDSLAGYFGSADMGP